MSFISRVLLVFGRKARHVAPPSGQLGELSRALTRDPVTLEPSGPRRTGLTTNDIDPKTGQPYADYLERRRARSAASSEPKLCGVIDDVSPEE
jgi:hypothetical protein